MNIQGLAELEKALDNLAKSQGKPVLRAAMRKAAKPMKEKAQALAPVRKGKLRASIKFGSLLNGRQKKFKRALTAEERDAIELYLGPSYRLGAGGRHGHLVEFGTSPHINGGKFAGSKHPGTAPQPFMRPAFDAEAKPTIERLKPILWDGIQRAILRNAKRSGWEN
ncbi:HK97-gp10 family putative phage morphogenesis protein [Rhodobacter sp. JA431]|uniref:HK97-gp10 family putative phage morphogenesis protein n=1 Tax=Rhodobacter sp. JA431 TaxID=570013 RepID=UPI000BE43ABB|nr:HK97-gp10 family putative phage morphogenesis protein [Rhodobacter sp. JA431]